MVPRTWQVSVKHFDVHVCLTAWYILRPTHHIALNSTCTHSTIANALRALTCFKLNTRASEPAADAKIEFFLSGNINYVNNKQWYNCGESDAVYDQIKKVSCVKYAGGCMHAWCMQDLCAHACVRASAPS